MEDEVDPVSLFLSLEQWQDPDEFSLLQDFPPSQPPPETFMVGFIIANIVGIQYYSGTISGREMVGLVREPLNAYDPNAIKVLNTRTVQVGHIERNVASVLAPLIDSLAIHVEGIVPNNRVPGNRFKIPCQVHVFARADAFQTVKSAISRGGLHLISDSDPSFTLSEAAVVKEKKKGVEEFKSVDEIFKLVDENASKKGRLEGLEPPQNVIKSKLFKHQKEGLGWLVNRENSNELPPFWEEKDGSYVNILTNFSTEVRPEPLRGGIFADDMGLGKTLTLLSLIAFDKFDSASVNEIRSGSVDLENLDEIGEEDGDSSKKGKRGRVSKKGTLSRKKRKINDARLDANVIRKSAGVCESSSSNFVIKTTLIVCPPSVFSTWVTQLQEHTWRGKLKVYMYYGERTNDVEELKKYDIVLTTYSTLAAEVQRPWSPVSKIEWWRVILDEAHVIKNVNARQSEAVTDLKAKRRWVVTGTPIQNGSFDLFSLMSFLRFEPFSIKSYWQSLVQRPLSQGDQKGLSRLQVLMATISLRRTKDKGLVGLPPKTIEICYVELSKEERELYDNMEGEAKSVFRNYFNAGRQMPNYSAVLSILLRLRQICIDLALCPSDLKSLLPDHNIEDVSNNPELLKKMVERKTCCPLCRRPVQQSDLFTAPPENSDADDAGVSSSKTTASSKVSTLLKLLLESRNQNPAIKSVVFSQFRKMLILLEKPLKDAGFKILRLDGSMNAKRRANVIEEFAIPGPDSPTVLLASLKASGTGINLTAASRVYLLEPWWNPAVEDQAMDRVHRIGQKEDVKIVRLIARNSIEERILELQARKQKLAREAFGGRGPKDRREIGYEDLRVLMSL
nr:putative swi/snf-related matrix-associated actin-dependent regulator [Quercus suber]